MSYDEKFVLFNDDDVDEFYNLLHRDFPEPLIYVIRMTGPVYPAGTNDITAWSVKYDPRYGPFKTIYDKIYSCVNGSPAFDPIVITVGLYG